MKNIISLVTVLIFLITGCSKPEMKYGPGTPESLGISSKAISNFIDAVEKERKGDLHSFVLMRHGQVAAQGWWNPYTPESPHMLFSLSKSFTSTAIGLAQAEGLLNINDNVISFFPDLTPKAPSKNLAAMRIRDLLTMNTGHNEDATQRMQADSNWVRGFLALPPEHKPGTHFVYNSAATFMLSAIIQKVTGNTLIEYLTPRLFEPLHIEHPTWETSPDGINTGGWGLKVRTNDIAIFGQLYLQKGMWAGKQLLPAAWVEEATQKQTANGSNPDSDWEQGYGYQFWRCRHDLYRGDGAFGQYCIVFPEQDAVLAITAGTSDMGAIMNLVWKNILPALNDEPVAEDSESFTALQNKLKSLSLFDSTAATTSARIDEVSGTLFTLKANDEELSAISLDLKSSDPTITLVRGEKSLPIPMGNGTLKKGIYPMPRGEETPVALSSQWISPDTLQVRMYLYETPFSFTNKIAFSGNNITIIRTSNVNIGPASRVEFVGTKKQLK